ncbi:MAG TPA: hypothetical protein VGL40_07990 [Bacillota bacterium]|jgi:hypothetical protein
MASISKIDRHGLGAKVTELSLTKSSREIARILKDEDGVDVSHKGVACWLKQVRAERRDATKAAVQEHIKKSIPKDLELLDHLIEDLRQHYEGEKVDKDGQRIHLDLGDKLAVAREIRHAVATKLRFSGALEGTGGGTLEEALEKLDDGDG